MPRLLCANPLCGGEVIPSSPFKRDCVYDGKKWWHLHCFQQTFPRKNAEKWLDKTEKYLDKQMSSNELEDYLKSHYNLPLLSSSFKKRIENLSNGKDDTFNIPIDQAQLLNMFKHYSSELEQRALYRRNSGVEGMMTTSQGEPCLRYDLNYILSKYNEYTANTSHSNILHSKQTTTLNIVSPDMTPVYKEQQRKLQETGQDAVQKMMDLYWDECC